jgi:hypothetical protein
MFRKVPATMTHRASPPVTTSGAVIVAGIVAIAAFGTAAVLFVNGDTALQRLGILFALFGLVVPTLVSSLRSDHAAQQTSTTSDIASALNGDFDLRVAGALDRVMANRSRSDRIGDPPPTPNTGRRSDEYSG